MLYAMPKGWTDKVEYRLLKEQLAVSSGPAFERTVLPFLRVSLPEALGTPARRGFDQAGIDHLVWSDTPPHRLVVQCKGFEKLEWELGADQIRQCRESIESFRTSGITTREYVLVHNRQGSSAEFRSKVGADLARLKTEGVAQTATLWDINTLLKTSFAAMLERVKHTATQQNISVLKTYGELEPDLCAPLTDVPLRRHVLVADQYKLRSASDGTDATNDPAQALLEIDTKLSLLVGYAGFGKTTATLRMTKFAGKQMIYVPAASFSEQRHGTKQILEQCVDIEEILGPAQDEDRPTWRLLARAAIEHFFKTDKGLFVLLIDGLDESVFFAKRGGLQHLFNALRPVASRIVLTTRKEYLEARIADFATSFGLVSGKQGGIRTQHISVLELLPWTDREIAMLASRFRDAVDDGPSRARLQRFVDAVTAGDYSSLYGDIPRRPLFLRFILETVAEQDVHPVHRAQLFVEWVRLKIHRDVARPAQLGGQRLGITNQHEGTDTTIELAFLAMTHAAGCMAAVEDGQIQLLPSCEANDVLRASPRLAAIADVTGLLLNSLLVPVRPRIAPDPLLIRFAHRAFQEFFLARFLKANPTAFDGAAPPDSVTEWVNAMDHDST